MPGGLTGAGRDSRRRTTLLLSKHLNRQEVNNENNVWFYNISDTGSQRG